MIKRTLTAAAIAVMSTTAAMAPAVVADNPANAASHACKACNPCKAKACNPCAAKGCNPCKAKKN